MLLTLISCVAVALLTNRFIFGGRAKLGYAATAEPAIDP